MTAFSGDFCIASLANRLLIAPPSISGSGRFGHGVTATLSMKKLSTALALVLLSFGSAPADAGVIDGNIGLTRGFRWDAAPRTVAGQERSLDGSLRYSLQGGSYTAYRDLFNWTSLPTVADFTQAVQDAFSAWEVIDPATGLTTAVSFVADFATPVVGTGFGGLNTLGAEIDLLGAVDGATWNVGDPGRRAESFFGVVGGPVTLTSGVAGYVAGAISGADITINSNPEAVYGLDGFRRLLTHEIGHALGFLDVDVWGPTGEFIDDNYDGTSAATAQATLNNSWALLVNPLNPAASPLALYTVSAGNPGIGTAGVDILMEAQGLGIAIGNPITNLFPLTNDEFGMRQFLYPSLQRVPEPVTLLLLGIGLVGRQVARRRIRRAAC